MKSLLTDAMDNMTIVNEDEYKRCVYGDEFEYTILADSSKININDFPNDRYEIITFLDVNNIEYIELGSEGCFDEPDKGEYIVVYSDDGIERGEDPYIWDYDLYNNTYWDGNNWQEDVYDSEIDVHEVHSHCIDWELKQEINYGRDIIYTVYKTENNEYYGEHDNTGYFGATVVKIKFDENMTDKEIEEEINRKIN